MKARICALAALAATTGLVAATAARSTPRAPSVPNRAGTIAFLHGTGSGGMLFVIRPDGSGLRALTPPSTMVEAYAWSPDGTLIAYFDQRSSLWLVHRDGTGRRQLLSGSRIPTMGMSWSPDSKTIAILSPPPGAKQDSASRTTMYLVPISGARPRPLPIRGVGWYVAWSPRGDEIAYRDYRDKSGISVIRPDGTGRRNVADVPAGSQWSADGLLLVFGSRLPYRPGANPFYGPVAVVDADGTHLHVVTTQAYTEYGAAWSPQGERLLYGRSHQRGIYVVDANGRHDRRVTSDSPPEAGWGALAWSPNGQSIVYTKGDGDNTDLFVVGVDGRGKVRLTKIPNINKDPSWVAR